MFLHGYLSSKESFYPQIGYFSRHFRVTAPDLPGFGGSDPIPAAWSVGEYADWLEGFLKERGIRSEIAAYRSRFETAASPEEKREMLSRINALTKKLGLLK